MMRTPITIAIVAAMLAASIGSSSCTREKEAVVVSYAPFETLALLWTAQPQGFFNGNDLEVTLRKYDTGAEALNGVLAGESPPVLPNTHFLDLIYEDALKKIKPNAVRIIR